MIISNEASGGRQVTDAYADRTRRQRAKELVISLIVTDGDEQRTIANLRLYALHNHRFADATQSHFDHLLSLEDLNGLVAEQVAEQESKLVRLSAAEIPCGGAVMPGHGRRLQFEMRARRTVDELFEDRPDAVHPAGRKRNRCVPVFAWRTTPPEPVLGPQSNGKVTEPSRERVARSSADNVHLDSPAGGESFE